MDIHRFEITPRSQTFQQHVGNPDQGDVSSFLQYTRISRGNPVEFFRHDSFLEVEDAMLDIDDGVIIPDSLY